MFQAYIGDLNYNDHFRLVTDSQDVTSLKNDEYPRLRRLKEYDSFFVLDNWDITEIWGFYGEIAYTYKKTYLLYQERKNPMAYNRLSNYATTVFTEGNFTKVVYHSTTIVKWTGQKIVLDSGRYQTATTKRKMNQASRQFNLGYTVYQEDFSWYVTFKGKTLPFQDEMILER